MSTIQPLVNITTSTFNRSSKVVRSVEASLNQIYDNFTLTVIDDNSSDDTRKTLERFFDNPRFCYIKLKNNIGTYQIRNLSLLINRFEAITFHDSDDIADNEKLLLQSRAMFNKPLNQEMFDSVPNELVRKDRNHFIVSKVRYIEPGGHLFEMGDIASLIQHMIPNVYVPNHYSIGYISTTHGLIHRDVFREMGGYRSERVSGDAEFRDRALVFRFNFYFVFKPLMTMIANADSLTQAKATAMGSDFRKEIEKNFLSRLAEMKKAKSLEELRENFNEVISIPNLDIEFISNPDMLEKANDIKVDHQTLEKINQFIN